MAQITGLEAQPKAYRLTVDGKPWSTFFSKTAMTDLEIELRVAFKPEHRIGIADDAGNRTVLWSAGSELDGEVFRTIADGEQGGDDEAEY